MTLDGMNEYLQKRGFTVERIYNPRNRTYTFEIEKYGLVAEDAFTWPVTSDWAARGREQKQFLDNLIRRIEECKEENNMEVKAINVDTDGISVIIATPTPVGFRPTPENIQMMSDRIEGLLTGNCSYIPFPKVDRGAIRYDAYSRKSVSPFDITRVIHNDPATIVFWADGTNTVVKCQPGDVYDPEKGLAMAISKKALGNQGNYCNVFKKWIPEETEPRSIITNMPLDVLILELYKLGIKVDVEFTPKDESTQNTEDDPALRWRIWYKEFNNDGREISSGLYMRTYTSKSSATRRAKKMFSTGDWQNVEWVVSQTNPWAADV